MRCLADLLANVELLDAEKPTKVDGEFENIELDAEGHVVIRNARYNTRVRRSKQVCLPLFRRSLCSYSEYVIN